MRALILVAGALALAACSNNDAHDNTTNIDQNLTAENIVSNDVTAIDAVTGQDANMAASAEINDTAPVNIDDLNDSAPAKTAAKTEKKSSSSDAAKPKKPADSAPTTSNTSE